MLKRYWWMFLVMAPVGLTVGILVAAVVTYMMPKIYESSAVIEVKPLARMGVENEGGLVSSSFQITDFEKIKSRNSLMRVVESLDLPNRRGMDRESIVGELESIVTVENLRGADLIRISVRHADSEAAMDIAAELMRQYRDHLTELEAKTIQVGVNQLKRSIREQEDRVEELRMIMMKVEGKRTGNPDDHSEAIEYSAVQKEYELARIQEEETKLKLTAILEGSQTGGCKISIVHESAVLADRPVSPNMTLNLVLGSVGGFLVSPLFALPWMWLMNRKHLVGSQG